MATRKTRTYAIRAKVWGKDSTMEFDGGLSEGIRYAFMYLPEKSRVALIELVAADHAKLLQHAAEQLASSPSVASVIVGEEK